MKKMFLLLIPFFGVVNVLSSSEPDCGTTGSTSVVLPNGNQPLVYVLVDFKDGRKQVGNNFLEVTTNSGLDSIPNLNAVGSMGWDKDLQGNYFKVARKYTYENYWDMIFSNGTYVGDSLHPDYISHNGTFDTLDGENYDLRVWGSIRDYWAEVSYNKWIIYPYATHGAGVGKYQTGIINNIDSTSVPGKKIVKWIMLDSIKSFYGLNKRTLYFTVEAKLRQLYSQELINFNIDDPFFKNNQGKIGIIYAGGHEGTGGMAQSLGDPDLPMFYHSEKITGYDNSNPKIVLCGIANHAHEYGHAIGIAHQAAGSYDLMHVGGLGKRIYQFSLPHVNPFLKLQREWLTASDTVRVISSRAFSLSPITAAQPKVGVVTIYGDAGRDFNWNHSEFFLLEYRKREKFNRFSGGVNANFGSDNGGVLIWHRSAYNIFRKDSLIGGGVDSALNIVLPYYGYSFRGNSGSSSHFYYSNRNSINQNTFPNTNANDNIPTGISISNFSVSNNQMNIAVNYTAGAVPQYTKFIYNQYQIDTSLSGKVFFDYPYSTGLVFLNILPGTEIQFPPNGMLDVLKMVAKSTTNDTIIFRGVGYGNSRANWQGITISGFFDPNPSVIKNCLITDAKIGVTIEYSPFHDTVSNNIFQNTGLDILSKNSISGYNKMPVLNNNICDSIKITDERVFANNQNLIINSGTTLILDSGAKLKLGSSSNIYMYGILKANGQANSKIQLTSLTGSSSGSFGSIQLNGSGAGGSNLNYIKMENGTEISVVNVPNFTLQNSEITNTINGINAYNSYGTIQNNSFTTQRDHGIISNASSLTINGNNISKSNQSGAALLLTAGTINTTGSITLNDIYGYNWGIASSWGSDVELSDEGLSNRVRNCLYGVRVYQSSSLDMSSKYNGHNSIRNNTYYHAYVYSNSYLYARRNYWGWPVDTTKFYKSPDSYLDRILPLQNDPWENQSSVSAQNSKSILLKSSIPSEPVVLAKELRKQGKKQEAFNILKTEIAKKNFDNNILLELYALTNNSPELGVEKLFSTLTKSENPFGIYLAAMSDIRSNSEATASLKLDELAGTPYEKAGKFAKFYLNLYSNNNYKLAKSILDELKSESEDEIELSLAQHALDAYVEVPNTGKQKAFKKSSNEKKTNALPKEFGLQQNYPNPFNPTTTIRFSIPQSNNVKLIVYDCLGREVETLVNEFRNEGNHSINFNASNYPSGVYFCKLQSGLNQSILKMVLVK